MSDLEIFDIPVETMSLIENTAKCNHISVNELIIHLIEQGLGIRKKKYYDLDHLAGTWTDEDKCVFDDNIKFFKNEVDF